YQFTKLRKTGLMNTNLVIRATLAITITVCCRPFLGVTAQESAQAQSSQTTRSSKKETDAAIKRVARDPASAEAQLALGKAYVDNDQYEMSISAFREALTLKPDYKEAYLALASAYERLKRYEDELIVYKDALAHTESGLDVLERMVLRLSQMRRYVEAADAQKLVVQRKPGSAADLNVLCALSTDAGRFDDALTACSAATRLDPHLVAAYYNTGVIHYRQCRYDDALLAYTRALSSDSSDSLSHNIHVGLANVFMMKGRFPEMLRAARRAVELQPSATDAQLLLGISYIYLSQPSEAISVLNRVLDVEPLNIAALSNLGLAYLQLERMSEAERLFRKVINLYPDNAEGYINLAAMLLQQ